jgi:ATP-dependent helicase HrpB
VVLEAMERGVGEDGCRAAALLGLGERAVKTDLLAALDEPAEGRLRQHTEQLLRVARPPKQSRHDDDALLLAVLAGFPDRLARRRAGGQVMLASGVAAEVEGGAPTYEFMVALDVEDRSDKALPLIRMTARVEPEWLLDLFPERVVEQTSLVWNRATERVEKLSALLYESLVLEESRGAALGAEAEKLLAAKVMEVGVEQFVDREEFALFAARVEFAGLEMPDVAQAVRELCVGLQSFNDMRVAAKNLLPLLEQKLGARRLNELAPTSLRLQGGRQTKVRYEHGRPPWIASRLQDFFGMKETPRIGPGKTPLVIHLLAPNQRAVQTTTDLAGFWERLYPAVRKELMRRYPRHAWPERPE